MKIRPNVKYLVNKYRDQISAWRDDGPLVASWEQICREVCSQEKLSGGERPTGDGLRKAWARVQTSQNSETSQTVQTNRVETPVVEPSATIKKAAKLLDRSQNLEKTQTSQNSETYQTIQKNRPPARTNPRFTYVPTLEEWESWPLEKKLEQGIPEAKPDGTRYMRPLKIDETKLLRRDARAAAFESGEL